MKPQNKNLFRVHKMKRLEVTHLINLANPEEFYMVAASFAQDEIKDRLYHREELIFSGREVSVKAPQVTMDTVIRFAGLNTVTRMAGF